MTAIIQTNSTIAGAFPAFKGKELRHVLIDGEPWFVARDVCRCLGLENVTRAIQNLADDEKGMNFIHTPGGRQRMSVISEPGIYKLIQASRKPEAKEFDRYVRHVVLPSIRKTGGYLLNEEARATAHADNLTSMPLMETIANALALAQGEIDRLGRVTADQTKVIAAQSVVIAEAAPMSDV